MALKKLAGQTAVYGLSSILGRFLNYLLVPIHTAVFVPAEYGVVTDVYALSAFGAVLLTFGIETAYFKYVNDEQVNSEKVLGNALLFLIATTAIFWLISIGNSDAFAGWLGYADHPEYIVWMSMALGFDALSAIPMAKLRKDEKPVKFAVINLVNIAINILVNVMFIMYAMNHQDADNWFVREVFNPEIGVGYVFLANMLASGAKWLLLLPSYFKAQMRFHLEIIKPLLVYAVPLMVANFAGIINETLDRRLIRIVLEPKIGETAALAQVGIYGACYKLSILITLFIQAFRYAAEPFFFSKFKEEDSKKTYALVMNWFTIAVSLMMVLVLLYIDLFKLFISDEAYWVGLHIVPILLFANIALGWNYNLSIWYKLTNKTRYGAYLAVIGAVITIVLNLLLIPKMGYTGAAWATLITYVSITVISYVWGQKYFYVNYDLLRMLGYPILGILLYIVAQYFNLDGWIKWVFHTFLFLTFIAAIAVTERKQIKQLLR